MSVTVSVAGSVAVSMAVIGTIVAAGLVAAPAVAEGTLDQSTASGPEAVFVAVPYTSAQTFTAGRDGVLDRVELSLAEAGDPSPVQPLTIEIRDITAEGVPGTDILAVADLAPTEVGPDYGWVSVPFAAPTQVVAGTQYAIVAHTSSAYLEGYYLWNGSTDGYDGGSEWSTADPTAESGWFAANDADLGIRTYVESPHVRVQDRVHFRFPRVLGARVGDRIPLRAHTDSHRPVTYVVRTPGKCEVAHGSVVATHSGRCRITAKVARDHDHTAAHRTRHFRIRPR